jgi:hypothetical protein
MSKVDDTHPLDILEAIEATFTVPGNHLHGEKALNLLLRADGYQVTRKALCDKFGEGWLRLSFGALCERVARYLGDPSPKQYALTDTVETPDGPALRLKPSVVEALKN